MPAFDGSRYWPRCLGHRRKNRKNKNPQPVEIILKDQNFFPCQKQYPETQGMTGTYPNHKQTNKQKRPYGMGENICKWSDLQGINFQNIQTAHTTQQQKKPKKQTNKKPWIDISPNKTYRWPTGTWKNDQHC